MNLHNFSKLSEKVSDFERVRLFQMKWQDPNKLEEYGRREVGDSRTGTKIRKMLLDGTALVVQLEKGVGIRNFIKIHKRHAMCLLFILYISKLRIYSI